MKSWKNLWLVPLSVPAIIQPAFAVDYFTAAEAQKVLFPSADRFETKFVELTSEQIKQIEKQSGVRQRTKTPKIWIAWQKQKMLGWVVVDDVIGKHEYITYATALGGDGKVLGVEIMSYRETHGGEVRDAAWREKFKGKQLSDPFKLDVDVPNISGATLSCRNVLDGVKRLLVMRQVIGQG